MSESGGPGLLRAIQPKDQQVEQRPSAGGGGGSGGGGGAVPNKVWTISGRPCVREKEIWDVLRTFRASPAAGWDTDLQVGNVDYGIVRFIDRAVDIHHLGDTVRTMLKRCIDPLATDEPRDALSVRQSA